MEYQLKLSEVIAGCENGSWLDGSLFINEEGDRIIFERNKFDVYGTLKNEKKWGFFGYVD